MPPKKVNQKGEEKSNNEKQTKLFSKDVVEE